MHFHTTLSAAQQVDLNLLIDTFQQNYTTNADILRAEFKATGQQPNPEIFAFLCGIRTLARRNYPSFTKSVEQSVLTSSVERLSGSTLWWEHRESNPPIVDDYLALGLELKFSLVIKTRTPSTTKLAKTSVNAISCDAPEPSTKEFLDEIVRIPTYGLKKTMPKRSPEAFRTQNSTPSGNQHSRSNSTDSQGNGTVHFRIKMNKSIENGRENNRRVPTRQTSTANRPNNKVISPKVPCKHFKRENHTSNECIACFKCGEIRNFRNGC